MGQRACFGRALTQGFFFGLGSGILGDLRGRTYDVRVQLAVNGRCRNRTDRLAPSRDLIPCPITRLAAPSDGGWVSRRPGDSPGLSPLLRFPAELLAVIRLAARPATGFLHPDPPASLARSRRRPRTST